MLKVGFLPSRVQNFAAIAAIAAFGHLRVRSLRPLPAAGRKSLVFGCGDHLPEENVDAFG
jgi:hypothetical protein